MLNQQVSREDLFRWLAFALIALAVCISYWSSLFYPPRADQVAYLAETVHLKQLSEMIFETYDWNRHRVFAPGDEILFRPLLFMILGIEQILLGHNFMAWQFFGILTHLALLWVLLRTLWNLAGGGLAFAGTWAFGLSVVNYEMVTWTQIIPYHLMTILIVLAIEQSILCLQKNELAWPSVIKMTLYLAVACFIYETANLFALCIMGLLLFSFPKERGRSLLLVVPVILYACLSFYNYVFVNHLALPATGSGISLLQLLWSIIHLSCWWLYEGLFNGMYYQIMAIRTIFREDEVMVFKPLILYHPQVVLTMVMLAAFFGILWKNQREILNRKNIFLMLFVMLFFYVAVIAAGRQGGAAGIVGLKEAVRINSYYLSFFWVVVVIMAFCLIPKTTSKTAQWLVILFIGASLASGLWQAKRIYTITQKYSTDAEPILLLIRTVDLLILEKGGDPQLTFYVHPQYPGNYPLGGLRKNTDPPDKVYSLIEILYPQYFRPFESAKYKFLLKESP